MNLSFDGHGKNGVSYVNKCTEEVDAAGLVQPIQKFVVGIQLADRVFHNGSSLFEKTRKSVNIDWNGTLVVGCQKMSTHVDGVLHSTGKRDILIEEQGSSSLSMIP